MAFRGQTRVPEGVRTDPLSAAGWGVGGGLASGVECQCMTGHGQVRAGLGKKAWMSSGSPEGSLSILSVRRKIW